MLHCSMHMAHAAELPLLLAPLALAGKVEVCMAHLADANVEPRQVPSLVGSNMAEPWGW